MLFVVQFFDDPAKLALRSQHMAAHLAFLDQHAARIRSAGSLRDITNDNPRGGLWIVEAESRLEVETLYQADPFWTMGLRQSVEVFRWAKAFPERLTAI